MSLLAMAVIATVVGAGPPPPQPRDEEGRFLNLDPREAQLRLARLDPLHRGGVDHGIDPLQGQPQPVPVPNVADKEP
jgi:hypothetical protein